MKNLFLLSLFGLFMAASLGGQTPESISLTASAYADEDSDNSATTSDDSSNNSTETSNNETSNNEASNSSAESSNNDSTGNNESSNEDEANNTEFHCPEGITTCYKSDGAEYNDINNLPPSAAGASGSASGGVKPVKPVHFRSF